MNREYLTAAISAKLAAAVVVVTMIAGCDPVDGAAETGGEAVHRAATEGWIRVVRGVNGSDCSAPAIGNGNDPRVGPSQDLTNLSVSCSTNKGDTVAELKQFLPSPHFCYSTLKYLRKARRAVVVVRDPTSGNPFHCLLGTITPKQFVARSRYQ